MGVLTPTAAASTAASGSMNSAPKRFCQVVTSSAGRDTSRRRAIRLYTAADSDAASTSRLPAQRRPAGAAPPQLDQRHDAGERDADADPLRGGVPLLEVNTLSTATKIGMAAIRMAASLALVRAMPRFSKVK